MLSKLPKIVGITGGIGSGKTLISSVFSELSIPVYNTDISAKKIISEDPLIKKAIISLLGESAYTTNGTYNIEFVKGKVFNNASLLTQLNNIVHPAVANDFNSWLTKQSSPYIIKESALLLKNNLDTYYKIIFCHTNEEERVSRIQKRDPERSIPEIKKIIKAQEFAIPKTDKVLILNNNHNQPILETILNWHKGFLN